MARISLRILDGADRGKVFENLSTPVSIGREEGNTIQLNDERVSRFHIKIQEDRDKIVLTDLESTNGTKVNGEEVQLRILRFGDVVSVGRSLLLFGSREQIARRLAAIRNDRPEPNPAADDDPGEESASLDSELKWATDPSGQTTLQSLEPPDLPERMSPAQAAQLCELLEYIHVRFRDLLATVKLKSDVDRVTLDTRQWQNLIDLQASLAVYLRSIGQPNDSD